MDGDLIAAGMANGKIKIWSKETGELLKTFEGHDSGVNNLTIEGGVLVSGGDEDRMVKVWNVEDGKCLHVCW